LISPTARPPGDPDVHVVGERKIQIRSEPHAPQVGINLPRAADGEAVGGGRAAGSKVVPMTKPGLRSCLDTDCPASRRAAWSRRERTIRIKAARSPGFVHRHELTSSSAPTANGFTVSARGRLMPTCGA